MRAVKLLKWTSHALITVPTVALSGWYVFAADEKQRNLINATAKSFPVIFKGNPLRCLRTFKAGVQVSADYKYSLYGLDDESEEYEETLKEVHSRSANRILEACLHNGGLYVKFGQGVVSMNHVLPKEYTETLSVLQDQCLTRRSDDEVDVIFEKDFGDTPENVFESFDRQPIAAASLAQVFKARTKDGRDMAVKVQYIDLRDRYDGDVATIKAVLNLTEVVHPKFSFGWILDDLKGNLAKELDFVEEGKNAERCAKDLAAFSSVYVPKVDWSLTSARVISTEFIDGIKISDVDRLKAEGHDLKAIDNNLLTTFAEQLFHTGRFPFEPLGH